jgi:hypothetical protein
MSAAFAMILIAVCHPFMHVAVLYDFLLLRGKRLHNGVLARSKDTNNHDSCAMQM